MNESSKNSELEHERIKPPRLADPEPFTVTVLTSVVSGLITAGLCHVAQRTPQKLKFNDSAIDERDYFAELVEMLESTDQIVAEIREVFTGEEKYDLSAITLLPARKGRALPEDSEAIAAINRSC